jgi:hypothetical protein
MDDTGLTLGEFAQVLDPPMSELQLRMIVTALGIEPSGARRTGAPGRPVSCYPASIVMRVHAAVAPFVAGCPGVKAVGMTAAKAVP